MDWTGKTGEQIEAELLVQMRDSLAAYQVSKLAQLKRMELWHAIEEGTPDGVVAGRRAIDGERALVEALADYQLSVRRFTEFVVFGRIPSD